MDNILYESLSRYFNTLSKLGYKSYSDVDRLLVLIFIQEWLEDKCLNYINEDDQRIIERVLYCLYGSSCLIPYPTNIVKDALICKA